MPICVYIYIYINCSWYVFVFVLLRKRNNCSLHIEQGAVQRSERRRYFAAQRAVSVKKQSFCSSLCNAIQHQKQLSTP